MSIVKGKMDTVTVGLVGAGNMARQHLKALRGIDWMQAVGITSRTLAKAQQLAIEYDIPICSEDMESLVRDSTPDALLVLVSAHQMYKVTWAALQYGLPLFIEKPAGIDPGENWRLAEVARREGVPTMVGFNRRYYSIFEKGIQIIRQHGPLMGVTVEGHERMWRLREGGNYTQPELSQWIFGNSVHTIDLLRLFGGEPRDVSSITHRYAEPKGDQFAAIMEMEFGAIGLYSAHWYSPGGWRVVLYGDRATVEFSPLEKGRWTDERLESHDLEPDEADVRCNPGYLRQMEAFGRLVRDGTFEWPMQDLEGSYRTMKLAERLTRDASDRAL